MNPLAKALTDCLAQANPLTIVDGYRPSQQVATGSVVNIIRYNLNTDEALNETWEIVGYDEAHVSAWQISDIPTGHDGYLTALERVFIIIQVSK